jgi:methionyl-tRNA synthetase
MIELVGAGNKYIDTQAPWALNKKGDTERLATVMRIVLEVCRVSAALLEPFCPERSPELARRLGTKNLGFSDGNLATIGVLSGLTEGAPVEVCEPLFPRITELPAEVVKALEVASTKPKEVSNKKQPSKKRPVDKTASKTNKEETNSVPEISFEDFTKVKFSTGQIISAEKHPNADRLLVVQVDLGEDSPRQIVAGIADKYTPEELIGKTAIVVTNLKPVKLRGVLSNGMLLAAGAKGVEGLATISEKVSPGTVVK